MSENKNTQDDALLHLFPKTDFEHLLWERTRSKKLIGVINAIEIKLNAQRDTIKNLSETLSLLTGPDKDKNKKIALLQDRCTKQAHEIAKLRKDYDFIMSKYLTSKK